MKSSRTSKHLFGILVILLIMLTFFILSSMAADDNATFLPVILNGEAAPFTPTEDGELAGGSHIFSKFIIPENVTITVLDEVTIQVTGSTMITGTLAADCTAVMLTGEGDMLISGVIDNSCAGDDTNAGDLTLYKTGEGTMAVGTETAVATLNTSGNLDVGNDPTIEEWEFDVLPYQRTAVPTPPVCAADADTVVDTVEAGFPVEIAFFGEGADPDGGPVSYQWDFGDGGADSGAEPLYSYTTWGAYNVTLTVTDDENQTCTATLSLVFDDGGSNAPTTPALWQAPDVLVAATGEVVYFGNGAVDPVGEALSYAWDFGDTLTSSLPSPTHTYSVAGVYPVTLTVTNESSTAVSATSSIYIYDAVKTAQEQGQSLAAGTCVGPGALAFNVAYTGGAAGAGKNGRSITFRGRGNTWIGPGTSIEAQDGGDGSNENGAGYVRGGRGGKGGSLNILVRGSLTVCTGATFAAGDGGDGGDATSNTPAPGTASAYGGNGGRAAKRLKLSATQGFTVDATAGGSVTLNPGSGGDGGWATANGGDGNDDCTTAQNGANAKAQSGNGGKASKTAVVSGNVVGIGNIVVTGGMGGDAGWAEARAGDGGEAICPTTAVGGNGGWAEARGGDGGDAKLSGNLGGMVLDPAAFTAGEGGQADAYGGDGGRAIATPSAPCEDTTATGGKGSQAKAYGGKAGKGKIDSPGGDGNALGGDGGDATATGGDCPGCGNEGGSATAISGEGAIAYAAKGKGTPDGTADAWGGDAKTATATGGKGGDCDQCPGGAGGPGGAATATGSDGGKALGPGTKNGGRGGDADAFGGKGGAGADCECSKWVKEAGGAGGDGGAAVANAGVGGDPDGTDGATGGSGGDGGDGGDGDPAGAGGAGGSGTGTPTDIPDGDPGLPGQTCVIVYTIWYIYHSSIPDGLIPPGTTLPLETFTTTVPISPTGIVPTRFMDATEVDVPPIYIKNENLLQFQGGIAYDLQGVLSTFPVIGFEARNLAHDCTDVGCIQVLGFSQGNLIGSAASVQTGAGSMETIVLPPPPSPSQLYDEIHIISNEFATFDHWGIVIIDP